MFRPAERSKKTVTNQLNVDGSSDNRRINSDIIPSIAPAWSQTPVSTLPAAVSLGSSSIRWRAVYCDSLYSYITKIAEAGKVNVGFNPPTQPPLTNQTAGGGSNCYWVIDDTGVATTRKVYRWSGSAWVDWTSQLLPGQAFYMVSGDRRLFIYSGSVGGLKKSTQFGST